MDLFLDALSISLAVMIAAIIYKVFKTLFMIHVINTNLKEITLLIKESRKAYAEKLLGSVGSFLDEFEDMDEDA